MLNNFGGSFEVQSFMRLRDPPWSFPIDSASLQLSPFISNVKFRSLYERKLLVISASLIKILKCLSNCPGNLLFLSTSSQFTLLLHYIGDIGLHSGQLIRKFIRSVSNKTKKTQAGKRGRKNAPSMTTVFLYFYLYFSGVVVVRHFSIKFHDGIKFR